MLLGGVKIYCRLSTRAPDAPASALMSAASAGGLVVGWTVGTRATASIAVALWLLLCFAG